MHILYALLFSENNRICGILNRKNLHFKLTHILCSLNARQMFICGLVAFNCKWNPFPLVLVKFYDFKNSKMKQKIENDL